MTNSSVFHFTETLCCKFMYARKGNAIAILVESILWHVAINHNKVLVLLSVYSICFSHADHLQIFKYITLKPKIKCIYINIYATLKF